MHIARACVQMTQHRVAALGHIADVAVSRRGNCRTRHRNRRAGSHVQRAARAEIRVLVERRRRQHAGMPAGGDHRVLDDRTRQRVQQPIPGSRGHHVRNGQITRHHFEFGVIPSHHAHQSRIAAAESSTGAVQIHALHHDRIDRAKRQRVRIAQVHAPTPSCRRASGATRPQGHVSCRRRHCAHRQVERAKTRTRRLTDAATRRQPRSRTGDIHRPIRTRRTNVSRGRHMHIARACVQMTQHRVAALGHIADVAVSRRGNCRTRHRNRRAGSHVQRAARAEIRVLVERRRRQHAGMPAGGDHRVLDDRTRQRVQQPIPGSRGHHVRNGQITRHHFEFGVIPSHHAHQSRIAAAESSTGAVQIHALHHDRIDRAKRQRVRIAQVHAPTPSCRRASGATRPQGHVSCRRRHCAHRQVERAKTRTRRLTDAATRRQPRSRTGDIHRPIRTRRTNVSRGRHMHIARACVQMTQHRVAALGHIADVAVSRRGNCRTRHRNRRAGSHVQRAARAEIRVLVERRRRQHAGMPAGGDHRVLDDRTRQRVQQPIPGSRGHHVRNGQITRHHFEFGVIPSHHAHQSRIAAAESSTGAVQIHALHHDRIDRAKRQRVRIAQVHAPTPSCRRASGATRPQGHVSCRRRHCAHRQVERAKTRTRRLTDAATRRQPRSRTGDIHRPIRARRKQVPAGRHMHIARACVQMTQHRVTALGHIADVAVGRRGNCRTRHRNRRAGSHVQRAARAEIRVLVERRRRQHAGMPAGGDHRVLDDRTRQRVQQPIPGSRGHHVRNGQITRHHFEFGVIPSHHAHQSRIAAAESSTGAVQIHALHHDRIDRAKRQRVRIAQVHAPTPSCRRASGATRPQGHVSCRRRHCAHRQVERAKTRTRRLTDAATRRQPRSRTGDIHRPIRARRKQVPAGRHMHIARACVQMTQHRVTVQSHIADVVVGCLGNRVSMHRDSGAGLHVQRAASADIASRTLLNVLAGQ